MDIGIKLLCENAKIPTCNNYGDAGHDLYSTEHVIIPSNERKTIKTGIAIEIPLGFVGLIWPRSGLSVKQGVDVLAGVVDATYRGEIMVCLFNTSDKDVIILEGNRIAQMLIQPVEECNFIQKDQLSDTTREDKGFGSSG